MGELENISYFSFAIGIKSVNAKILKDHSFQSKMFELSGLVLILLILGYSTVNHIARIQFTFNHYEVSIFCIDHVH